MEFYLMKGRIGMMYCMSVFSDYIPCALRNVQTQSTTPGNLAKGLSFFCCK